MVVSTDSGKALDGGRLRGGGDRNERRWQRFGAGCFRVQVHFALSFFDHERVAPDCVINVFAKSSSKLSTAFHQLVAIFVKLFQSTKK